MKFKVGHWVIVTKRRLDGPDMEMVGKVIEATPDYAVAQCGRGDQAMTVTLSEDTASIVFFRRMTQRDWNRRGC
jgi:hypothetical protein